MFARGAGSDRWGGRPAARFSRVNGVRHDHHAFLHTRDLRGGEPEVSTASLPRDIKQAAGDKLRQVLAGGGGCDADRPCCRNSAKAGFPLKNISGLRGQMFLKSKAVFLL
jgi:hypothetical protein